MDDLTYELRQLCRRNRDGSHARQADRLGVLTLIGHQLRELGFRQMHASSLKRKHVEALITRWQAEGLSAGTQKNRMTDIRWWAEKVGKAGIIPAENAELAIPNRVFVTNENKARALDDRLSRITDIYVRMSLLLQALFGFRREESIKFRRAMLIAAIISPSKGRGAKEAGRELCRSTHPNNAPCSTRYTDWPAQGR
jgi:hypothetical protein